MPTTDGYILLDDDGKRILNYEGKRQLSDDDANDCCCGDAEWYLLVPCPEQDDPPLIYYVPKELAAALGSSIIKVGDFCYEVGPRIDDTTGLTEITSGTAYPNCNACLGIFECIPDIDETLLDSQVEATYPDITVDFNPSICGCFTSSGPDRHVKYTDFGIAGHKFLLTPSALVRDTGIGHCRNYDFYSLNNPATSNVGELQVDSVMYNGGDCDDDSTPSMDNQDHVQETSAGLSICCDITNGWTYNVTSVLLNVNVYVCFNSIGVSGLWNGRDNPIATIANTQTIDVDCAQNGVGSDNACGDGVAQIRPKVPGF